MSTCSQIQEKLVAEEELSPEENDHLAACRHCRQLEQMHRFLLGEAARLEKDEPLPERGGRAAGDGKRRGRSQLAWALACSGALALVAALWLRPGIDAERTAAGLETLLEEIETFTSYSSTTGDHLSEEAGWLSMELESGDPSGGQYDWL